MPAYSISNNTISITVNSLGAELTSFKNNDSELLWQTDKSVWNRSAPVLFPVVGKLKDNRFIYNDAVFNMLQHGFARDEEFVLIENGNNVLEFE
jgi:galactose mutarotase-like enzyme